MTEKKPTEEQDELTTEDLERVSGGDGNWGSALTVKQQSPLGNETEDTSSAPKSPSKIPR